METTVLVSFLIKKTFKIRDCGTGACLWILQNFWEHLTCFYRRPLVAVSVIPRKSLEKLGFDELKSRWNFFNIYIKSMKKIGRKVHLLTLKF